MNKIYKIIISTLIIAMFFCIIPKTEYAAEIFKIGDINGDGLIDSRDTLRLLEHIAASTIPKIKQKHPDWILTGEKLRCADINQDGLVDSRDTLRELEYIAATTIPAIAQKHPDWKTYLQSKWTIEVMGISLDKTSITMDVGKVNKLVATINPVNATNKVVTWSSSDIKVATVDALGNIEGKNEGITIITAKSSNGKMATCKVEVKSSIIAVTGILLDKTALSLTKGDTATLVATINPTNATNKNITWSSSNDNIVSVSNGNITAKNEGTATITATSSNGKTATCTISVKLPEVKPVVKPIVKPVEVSSITLRETDCTIAVNTSLQLNATVLPTNASNKTITWSSSDNSIAKVDKNGVVKGIKPGKVTITVKTSNNKTATCIIRVNIPAKSISLNKTSLTINKGSTQNLTVNFNPTNTTSKVITWKSSNNNIATVNTKGTVTAKSKGNAIITATSKYGKTATCKVTVTDKVLYVSKNGSDSNSGTSPNNALKTIKKGISKLSAGYTLMVNAGTYNENDISLSKSGTSSNPIKIIANGNVIINGSGKKRLLKIQNTKYVEINGFTFQNLYAKDAKGIIIYPNTENLSIINCKFINIKTSNPRGEDDGASAIFIDGSSTKAINNITIKNCTLTNISAGWSEAISVDGNCTNITITGVKLTSSGIKGNIGICICGNYGTCSNKSLDRPRNVIISNCYVSNCKSPYDPGSAYGIYIDGGANVTISNNTVENCEGGIEIGAEQKNSKLSGRETENIKVLNNTIKNCGIGAQIGGWDGKATVYNVLFDKNTLLNCGHGHGKAIEFSKCKNVTISNCRFNTKQSRWFEGSSMAKNVKKKNNTSI